MGIYKASMNKLDLNMDEIKVKWLMEQGENEFIEFKEFKKLEDINDKGKKDLAKLFVALANNRGGLVLFGVTDNGKFDGYNLTDDKFKEFEQLLIQIANTRCSPPIYLENIKRLNVNQNYILTIEVPFRKSQPHNVEGVLFRRVGPHNVLIKDPSKIEEFYNKKNEMKLKNIIENAELQSEDLFDISIKNYLNKIINEDKTIGVSEVYTELYAKEIFPATLRLDDVREDGQIEFEVFDLIKKEKKLIISGVSGSGKTTTLKWLNVILSEKYLKEENSDIPIYIELNSYIRGTFFDYVKIKSKEKELYESTLRLSMEGKAIFLIDGLDLLSPTDDFAPYDEILNFVSEYNNCKYVISSRPGFFESFRRQFKISELEEMTDDKICLFIEKYVTDYKLSKSIKDKIGNDEKLTSIFRNPMMLYLAIKVAILRRDNKNEVLPSNRSKMYGAFISDLFDHYLKKNKTLHADRIQIEETLIDFYFKLQCRNKFSCKYQHALDVASKHAKDMRFNKTTAQNILYDIFKLGLLSRADYNIKYGFHQSFQEYFAAIKLKKCFEKGIDISQTFGHPKWQDSVIFASEMFDNPDEFIKSIIAYGELYLASKCAKNASQGIKEELCILLAEKLDSKFVLEKTNAIDSVGRFGDIGISIIIEALNDKNAIVRWKAAFALGELKTDKVVEPLINALRDENLGVRWRAVDALGELRTDKVVEPLINALKDDNKMVRARALEALSKIKTDKTVELLINALRDENKGVREKATYALGKMNSDKAIEPLINLLRDDKKTVRKNVAYALARIKSDKTIELLSIALEDENETVQESAAYALRKIQSDKAIEILINALKNGNKRARWRAADALGKIQSDKAVEPLINSLNDENTGVRRSAIYALGEIGSNKAVESLIETLKDEKERIRKSVTDALGKIKSDKVVEPLINSLNDENKEVRRSATFALGKIKSDRAVEPLIRALEDNDDIVRGNAVESLGKIRSDKAIEPLIKALGDNDQGVRGAAADALGKIRSDKVIEPLIKALKDENLGVQLRAVYALGEIKSDKAVQPLVNELKNYDEIIRLHVINALGEIKSDKAVQPLVNILKDENERVQSNVTEALAKINSDYAVEPLINSLNNENKGVRRSATFALCKIKSDKAVQPLINALGDNDEIVRGNAVYALGKIKSDRAIEPLIKSLEDNEEMVRGNAVYALGEIKSDRAVEPLIKALRDIDAGIRWRAANALGEIKSDRAVEPLINALTDENGRVRWRVADALKKICTIKNKERLEQILVSKNEFISNNVFEILREIEQSEQSKTELFKKNITYRENVSVLTKNQDETLAKPAEEGFYDPYFGIFVDRLKSETEPIYIVDYGCGKGKILCAMKSLPEYILKNITYIGVEIKAKYRYSSRLTAEKYGFFKSFRIEPEFLKPDDFFAKDILANYILIMHSLHEIKLVDLIEMIYSTSSMLKTGGRIFILDQRELIEEERYFVLWDDEKDFETLFLDSGFEQYPRFFTTGSGKKLCSIESIKRIDNCFSKEKITKNCMAVYESKREKLLKTIDNGGISNENFQELSVRYTNISTQIEEFKKTIKSS